jgi:hypothetical protein
MNYGDILSRAWRIIWKHKVLWIFGIFAGCGQSSGSGGGNSGFSFSGGDENAPLPMRRFFFGIERFFENLQNWQITLIIVVFVLIILTLIVLALVLGTVGRIGIIQGTVKGKAEDARLSFGDLLRDGYPFFWRVLGLNVLLGIVFFFLILILLVPFTLITAVTFGIAILCLLPFICLLIPVGWLVTVVIEQANIAIVVEDLNIIEGLQRGWDVFKENLGVMIVMGLILLIGGWIVGLVIGLPIAFLIAPAVIGVIAGSEYAVSSGLMISAICFVGYLPVLIALSGILRAYIGSAWTLTFLNLTSGSPQEEPVVEPQPEAS